MRDAPRPSASARSAGRSPFFLAAPRNQVVSGRALVRGRRRVRAFAVRRARRQSPGVRVASNGNKKRAIFPAFFSKTRHHRDEDRRKFPRRRHRYETRSPPSGLENSRLISMTLAPSGTSKRSAPSEARRPRLSDAAMPHARRGGGASDAVARGSDAIDFFSKKASASRYGDVDPPPAAWSAAPSAR